MALVTGSLSTIALIYRMKLTHRVALRLSLALLPIMVLWAVVFYFTMIDQINDDADDALEDYSERIIMRILSGEPLPKNNDGSNNSYTLKRVSDEYAASHTGFEFYDTEVFIPEQEEIEPARVLSTIFKDNDGQYFNLVVSMPTFEKEDLFAAILQWIVVLYIILLLTVLLLTTWVFHKSLSPLYRLLQWLDNYKMGAKNTPVPDDTPIEEFRKLSGAAQRAMNRSEELFEQQKQFIGNASHELQTPLSVLKGRIEWLLDHTSPDEDAMGQLVSMQHTISHIVRLNKTLLLLSKIDNEQFPESVDVDMVQLCRDRIEFYEEIYADRNIHMTVHMPDRFIVYMNETLASIVVSNLIRNAYVHSRVGANVEVRLCTSDLTVLNDGDGPLDGAHIFERFYQGSKREGSTGLGLALVDAVCRYYCMRVEYDFKDGSHLFSVIWSSDHTN